MSNITGYISGRSATTGVIGPIVPGAIVADLPLHFWVALTSTRYDKSIWRSSLASVFPREARPPIHDALDRIRTLETGSPTMSTFLTATFGKTPSGSIEF